MCAQTAGTISLNGHSLRISSPAPSPHQVENPHRLLRLFYLRLRGRIWTLKEKGCDLLIRPRSHIDRAVNTIARFQPVRFANSNCEALGFGPIPELNLEDVAAEDYRYAMAAVAMPRSCVSGRKL